MSTDFDQMTIKIKADSTQVSKDDESNIIANLFSFFADKQLYLTSLFSANLTAWVQSCIKADVNVDLYEEWMTDRDKALGNADVIRERNAQIHDLQIQADQHKTTIGELKLTIGERDAAIERDAKTMQNLQDIVTDLSEGVISYQEDAEAHEAEINKLKAQLWDLAKHELIKNWGTGGV